MLKKLLVASALLAFSAGGASACSGTYKFFVSISHSSATEVVLRDVRSKVRGGGWRKQSLSRETPLQSGRVFTNNVKWKTRKCKRKRRLELTFEKPGEWTDDPFVKCCTVKTNLVQCDKNGNCDFGYVDFDRLCNGAPGKCPGFVKPVK